MSRFACYEKEDMYKESVVLIIREGGVCVKYDRAGFISLPPQDTIEIPRSKREYQSPVLETEQMTDLVTAFYPIQELRLPLHNQGRTDGKTGWLNILRRVSRRCTHVRSRMESKYQIC